MKDPDGKVRYQEAGRWFIHLSNLRRTTVAFVFMATGASIGFVEGKLLCASEFGKILPLAIVNILLISAGILQEWRLHAYHKGVGRYLRDQEEDYGPYSNTYKPTNIPDTTTVILGAFVLLAIGWIVILIVQIITVRLKH